ncbi:DNA primase [Candidatus Gracilibacteria bacterium]|nr:DNA primase [Candidatus Gracilibacteria bacterium]NUJ98877.1 DNA primase [Candidatus Gracilibacteria bacterium]
MPRLSIIQELEDSIDIVELVSKYAKLKKTGANYKALCPFPGHNEKTPSFVVSPGKQIAYCFGCHRGGGPLKFIMDIENCEFKEAVDILAQISGRKDIKFGNSKKEIENEKDIFSLHQDIVNYYKKALFENKEILKYLEERGMKEEQMKIFNIGFADSGHNLYRHLEEKNYKETLIEEAKIFSDLKTRKDKFLGRLIFPIQNLRGDFVGFAGRIIKVGEPKYLNSPATKIYDKSAILYGLYQGKKEIIEKDFVIICEGYMDVISLHQAGYKNTVCVSGTALTEKQIEILKRLTHKFYLCFDNDDAGEKATRLSIENLKNKGIEVKIIKLENGKDPDEIIKNGINFQEFIDNALSPIGFLIQNNKTNLKSLEEKKIFLKEVLEVLKSYSDNVEKDFYIKEIATKLDINIKIVYDEFNKLRFKKEEGNDAINSQNYSYEQVAIAYILAYPQYKNIWQEKILFLHKMPPSFSQILTNEKNTESLPLEEKELLRGLSFEIEEKNKNSNEEMIINSIEKIIEKINISLFKEESSRLKSLMQKDKNDINTLTQYNELLIKAKKYKIKT